ncbi:unnamed protein product [Urochloa humidicola]
MASPEASPPSTRPHHHHVSFAPALCLLVAATTSALLNGGSMPSARGAPGRSHGGAAPAAHGGGVHGGGRGEGLLMEAMAGVLRPAAEKDLRAAAMASECRAAAEEELRDVAAAEELRAAVEKDLWGGNHVSCPCSNLTAPSSIRQHWRRFLCCSHYFLMFRLYIRLNCSYMHMRSRPQCCLLPHSPLPLCLLLSTSFPPMRLLERVRRPTKASNSQARRLGGATCATAQGRPVLGAAQINRRGSCCRCPLPCCREFQSLQTKNQEEYPSFPR